MIAHNETVILVTVGLICLLSMVVVYLQVFGKKGLLETGDKPDFDFSKIEESLKKILSQTHNTIATVSTQAPNADGTAAAGASSEDVAALKAELDSRVKMIEALTRQVESAKGDDSSPELLSKIKTLEGKLAEYEIIEDDIADLSHYKEENARLKKEIEGVKRGGPELVDQFADAMKTGADAASAAPAPAVAPAPAAAPAPAVAAAPTAAPAAVAKTSDPNAGQIAEAALESALAQAQQKASPAAAVAESKVEAAPAPAPAPAQAAAAPTAAPVAPSPSATEAKGDIFAEFSDSGEENKDPMSELGDIDTNRMLEELNELNLDMSVGAEALEEAPDIDKMANEAQTLGKKN